MTKSRGILAPRKVWSADEIQLLTVLYGSTFSATLAKLFSCSVEVLYRAAYKQNLRKSAWYQNSPMAQRLRNDCSMGIPYRFKKGDIPPNKGKKTPSHPNMVPTQFKPGQKPPNYKPVGSIRIDSKDGYILIKMAEGMFQWKLLHRVIWERMNGPVPHGMLVSFIDGNNQNCKITNLTLITKKQNALRNSYHQYGKEIAQLYQLKGQITRQINKQERLKNE